MSKLHAVFGAVALAMAGTTAHAVPVAFTKLSGIVGGAFAGTAVYQADLSGVGLASVQAVTIRDSNSGSGGAGGEFSGFDLDAIIFSNTNCADAACAAALAPGLPGFTYPAALFAPGAQRVPVDPKLFGSGPAGNTVDNAIATLGAFDGESIAGPGADGFISMGDGGQLTFNLAAAISTTGLFLYIGEVGDNGEVAAGDIQVFDTPQATPVPATLTLLGAAMALLGLVRRRKN